MNTTTTRPLVDANIRPANITKRAGNGNFPSFSVPFGQGHIQIAKPSYMQTALMKRVVIPQGRETIEHQNEEAGIAAKSTTDGANPTQNTTNNAWMWVAAFGLVIGIVLLVEYNR